MYFAHPQYSKAPQAPQASKAPNPPVQPPKPPGGGLTSPTPSPLKKVSLSGLLNAVYTDPKRKTQQTTNWAAVKPVEDALVAEKLLDAKLADGHFGTATVAAYAAWQRRCGYKSQDADGSPGLGSLTRLGSKHGFVVVK